MNSSANPLVGTRLQRLDSPTADLLSLVLTQPGADKQVLLVRLRGRPLGLGLVESRPIGEAASPTISKLRKHIQGAVIESAEFTPEGHLHCMLRRGDQQRCLEFSFGEKAGNCVLYTTEGRPIVALHQGTRVGHSRPDPTTLTLAALTAMGQRLLMSLQDQTQDPEWRHLGQTLKRRRTSLTRRLTKIEQEQARGQEASALRTLGSQLLSQLHSMVVVDGQVELTDYTQDPPQRLWLELQPQQTPQAYAQQLFERARRFERGARIAAERAASTRTEIAEVDTLLAQVRDPATSTLPLEALQRKARALGTRGVQAPANRSPSGQSSATQRPRQPYREFRSRNGLTIRVGRGAKDNDQLTLHHSRPNDLFLHVRGVPGAHVIVALGRDGQCPTETLIDGAALAVHFSRLHREAIVDVSYTHKRHVRKPKGAAPGQVMLQQEKVLPLRMDQEHLRHLLATEHKN